MRRDGGLLLGGVGFIGTALARRLTLGTVPLHILRRHQEGPLEHMLYQCSTVVHLACTTTPGASTACSSLELGNPALTSTLRLLDLLKKPAADMPDFLFLRRDCVWQSPSPACGGRQSDGAAFQARGQQGLARGFLRRRGRVSSPFVALRMPTAPGQAVKRGFGLVRTVLEHARLGTEMEIWGDGDSVRDFIHVDDVVEARALGESPQDSETCNLGSGKGHASTRYCAWLRTLAGAS